MLADHVEKNNLQGKLKYSLFVGASSGAETENRWARLDMIERRTPHQVGKEIAKGINEGRIKFFDKHLSKTNRLGGFLLTLYMAFIQKIGRIRS
jgi:acetyl-CoA hydrolase